ncbi:hypothetical protein QYF36_007579 [Acer negundo]|nr:hypothetical protein QYF36_007579 [Acer negundo]
MDFSAILLKSASSSATETEKCSFNESLLQAIDSEFKHIVHWSGLTVNWVFVGPLAALVCSFESQVSRCELQLVCLVLLLVEETSSQFTFELNRDFNKGGRASIVLTKEFQGELLRVVSGYFFVPHFDFEDVTVTISKHRGSSLHFNCSYTPDEISISDITVHDRHQYLEFDLDVDENVDENENLKKVFQNYLEVRGIKPSNIEFIFKCISNNYRTLTVLKKIKNFILFSAFSLALTASRLDQANKNYHSAVFSASSHLNRKPTLGSFVPDFEFSSATETKKCSSNIDSLL